MTTDLHGIYSEWEREEHARREQSDRLKELFKAAKSDGFNPKGLRVAFAEKYAMDHETGEKLQKRSQDASDADLYLATLADPRRPAYPRVEIIEEFDAESNRLKSELILEHDPETGEITEPQSAPQAASDPTPPMPSGQVAPIQPEMPLVDSASGAMGLAEPAYARDGGMANIKSAPLYAEPGVITHEQNGPEPMVAHPFAACWPVNSIDAGEGIREPIVKIAGMILDGRGRYLAARAVRTSPTTTMEYPTVQYDGTDPLADCIRWNLASRNLGEAQLRTVAAKLVKAAPERADDIMEMMGLERAEAAQ